MDGSISGCSESRDSMFPGFLPVTGHGVDRNVCGCRKSVCHKKHLKEFPKPITIDYTAQKKPAACSTGINTSTTKENTVCWNKRIFRK